MANVIVNNIQISFDPDQTKVAQEIFDSFHSLDDQFASADLSTLYENPENTRGWWEENIGAKWARIQDMSLAAGEMMMNIESAWTHVDPFVHRLMEMFNNQCTIRHEWVDEWPTEFGYRVYDHGVFSDEEEFLYTEEEIHEEYNKAHKTTGEPTQDEMWDWVWDWCYSKITEPAEQ